MATKLQPLNDNVFIEPINESETMTVSGLVVVKKEGANGLRPGRGRVLGVGPSVASALSDGDEVLYLMEFAQHIEVDHKRFVIMKAEHISAKVVS